MLCFVRLLHVLVWRKQKKMKRKIPTPSRRFTDVRLEQQVDVATERERHLTTGKRAERTKLDFRCPICHSAIGQASCLICARRRQLTFPFPFPFLYEFLQANAKYLSKGYLACMNYSHLIFPCLPNTRYVHFLYPPSPPPPPPPTTTIRFLMVRLWTFLQMAFSTMFCSSQRSKKPLGKTPTHKVARKYLAKSVVLILMLNMQICSCPHILKI